MTEQKLKKVVYFVRHGQSADNVAAVFQSPDSPLNDKGLGQAERIAERISEIEFSALISSPFLRAKQTAQAIGRSTNKEPELSELFTERLKPSSIDGKPYDNEEANRLWREWEISLYTPGMRVEDGENFDDQIARADKALSYLQTRPEESLVVVTHGYFLRTIVARVLLGDQLSSQAFRNFQRSVDHENTGITVLRYHASFEEEPRWRLWMFNDHSHLG